MDLLATDINSKAVALCQEAFLAAKAILRDQCHVRGGPWLSIRPLCAQDMVEVAAVARCKSLVELGPLSEELGRNSRLYQHVKDLKFTIPVSAKSRASASSAHAAPSSSTSSKSAGGSSGRSNARKKANRSVMQTATSASSSRPRATARAQGTVKENAELCQLIVRKRSGTRSFEAGHDFRVRTGLLDGDPGFDEHKYGKQGRQAARQKHWQTCVRKRLSGR